MERPKLSANTDFSGLSAMCEEFLNDLHENGADEEAIQEFRIDLGDEVLRILYGDEIFDLLAAAIECD